MSFVRKIPEIELGDLCLYLDEEVYFLVLAHEPSDLYNKSATVTRYLVLWLNGSRRGLGYIWNPCYALERTMIVQRISS